MNTDRERNWVERLRRSFVRAAQASSREDLIPAILAASAAFLRSNAARDVRKVAWPAPTKKTEAPEDRPTG